MEFTEEFDDCGIDDELLLSLPLNYQQQSKETVQPTDQQQVLTSVKQRSETKQDKQNKPNPPKQPLSIQGNSHKENLPAPKMQRGSSNEHVKKGGKKDTPLSPTLDKWFRPTKKQEVDINTEELSRGVEGDNTSEKDDFDGTNDVQLPDEFPFPFEPYDIQLGFMENVYKTLELGKVGIFESPTGTGKSLSLICGALKWLKDFEEKQKKELEMLLEAKSVSQEQQEAAEAKDDWISAFVQKREEESKNKQLKEAQEQRLKREARLQELRNNLRPKVKGKRKRPNLEQEFDELFKDADKELKESFKRELDNANDSETCNLEVDDDICMKEYNSDDECYKETEREDEEEDEFHVTKIYFCSRTHSQLSQFIREVQKSPYGEGTRVVSLGSRQNMCINEQVKKLKSLTLMNDRCLEMQKKKESRKKTGESEPKKKKSVPGCPFYKQDPLYDFRDRALVEVSDIEQLVNKGKQMKACPYYGTRLSIPGAELVALPYNTLLHKSTRDATGVKLKDNIVVIDEAHNLLETINNVYSIEITGSQVCQAHSQLSQYMEKFKSRLLAKNLMYIKQLLYILASFIKCLGGKLGEAANMQYLNSKETRLMTMNDFVFECQLDNLNLFKVLRYCERSQISKKLQGYVEKYQPSEVKIAKEKEKEKPKHSGLKSFLTEIGDKNSGKSVSPVTQDVPEINKEDGTIFKSPMMHIEGFLMALTNLNKDGRIVLTKQDLLSRCCLKFLLLNPAVHFADIVADARAVIVAGGTMQPLDEFKEQLFYAAGVAPSRILEYSCGHVIHGEQLLPICLSRGPSGTEFDFTFQSREKTSMLDETGRVLCNLCNVIPGGLVCFLPSYDYERIVYNHWEKQGYLKRMRLKKQIFREPKKASQLDQVLGDYSAAVQKGCTDCKGEQTGALLLCVVGGKMSEGINFSDNLGRCVIMIGLPFPNLHSPELKEKMNYLNANHPNRNGKTAGQEHYENLCMKAVNQSIGRAIRHKGDYATILMLDTRYSRPNIRNKLPTWISKHVVSHERFGPAFSSIRQFFSNKT
ncbi:unnamed protein product [Owenia fusiformis]|uniref:Uncharacterized protein n=1 Tax=Owenia fusiformis TaxID=6347 RepID=A0A8J1T4I9_OWEFU|nr:unnamed protein product [Owenia fusiformis]